MSQLSNVQQSSNFSTTTEHFEQEQKSTNSDSTVDISIEKLEGRQRRIFATIEIPYSLEQVWQVLTDYEAWVDFMPGTTQCNRLASPNGGTRLEQVRTKTFMGLKKSGRSVFDVQETAPTNIHYELVEGDLQSFSADWRLKTKSSNDKIGVELTYDISVVPKAIFPMPLVEHILSHDVPASLLAVRQRVESLYS